MATSRRAVLHFIMVMLAAAAPYLQTAAYPFLFDDNYLVVQNAFLREPWSAVTSFAHHFWHGTPFAAGYYRPLVVSSLALNGRLLGWGPAAFHLVNILLHAANAALLFALLRRLQPRGAAEGGPREWLPLGAALLFALHPVAAWPVASVVARVDLLPALFILLAWTAYARGSALLTALAFLGALLCKESAVAFLAVPILGLRAAGRGTAAGSGAAAGDGAGRHRLSILFACLVAFSAYIGLRRVAGAGFLPGAGLIDPLINPLAHLAMPGRLFAALALAGRYLLYLFVPARFGDPRDYVNGPLPALPDFWALAAIALLLAGTASVVLLWVRRDRVALPLAFAIGAFLPASNILTPIGSLYAQNFLYLPLLGLVIAAADLTGRTVAPAGTENASGGSNWRRVPAAALLLVLGVAAFAEARIWRDPVALFTAWTGRFPNYALARAGLGIAYLDRNLPSAAVAALRKSIGLDTRSAEPHYNLAVALLLTAAGYRAGLEEALSETRAAIRLDPLHLQARVNAARILLMLDRPAEAEPEAREALRLMPGFMPARRNLAESLYRQERYAEAAGEYGDLVRDLPADPDVRSGYVVCLIHAGDLVVARAAVEAARKDFPDLAWFDFCLARVEARTGNRAAALAFLRRSLDRDPATGEWVGKVDDFRGYGADLEAILPPAR